MPPRKALGDRGFASAYGLPDLETLELRVVDVERLVLAGILVSGAKCLRLGPRFEGTLVLPDRMRRIESVKSSCSGPFSRWNSTKPGTLFSCESRLSHTFSNACSDPFFTRKRFMAMNIFASPR